MINKEKETKCPKCQSKEFEQNSIVGGKCTCSSCKTIWYPKEEKIPKTYPSEEEVVKLICNSLEENLLKNMSDTTDFRELMEKIAEEFQKRYPEKKSKLITL